MDSPRLYPAEVPGLACPPADRTAQLAVIEEMRREGAAERRIRLRHLIRAAAGVEVAAGSTVRAWLPLPSGSQVADVRIVDVTPGMAAAPEDAPQRTAFWEAEGVREFFVEYEYLIRAPYVDLWAPEPVPAAPDARFRPAPAPCAARPGGGGAAPGLHAVPAPPCEPRL